MNIPQRAARRGFQSLHRLVPRKLEQLFDDPEIIFEQLLLYGVSYCLNQPTYVNGGEIEQ